MRRELMTHDELMSQLREQGIEDIATVRMARLESDGQLSVLTYSDASAQGKPAAKSKASGPP